MVPKTKLQKKVAELSSKLSPITDKQMFWGYEKCFSKYFVRSRKTLYCLECGHTWKDDFVLGSTILGAICPSCGAELKINNDYHRILSYSAYLGIITTKGDMQVVRMIYMNKFMKKGQQPIYSATEVMQHWIGQDGKVTTMSKTVQGLSRYYDQWILGSNLEIRPGNHHNCPRYSIIPDAIYPERKILPIIKRNGFRGQFHGFTPHHLFSIILDRPFAETLLKSGQISMLKYTNGNISEDLWPSIKICIRNNYIIKDASIWKDYISLLRHFGKDLHSSKYVCPENLLNAHDKLLEKKFEEERKEKLIEMRKKIEKEQKNYANAKGKFFGIQFHDGNLLVKPLESVEEFMIEGDELHHCVFANEYYKKDNSLILSARIDSKPIETIEFSLSDLKIIQSRGLQNKATKYHDRIINLVKSNIPKISKRIKEKEEV